MENHYNQGPNKFWVPDKAFPGFYLPSIQSILKLFGLPHNIPLILQEAEDHSGLDSKISRTQMYKMVSKGISWEHRESFLGFCRQILPMDFDVGEMAETFSRSYAAGSNAGAWIAALQGYSQTEAYSFDLPVIEFMRGRAETDLAFLESSKSNKIGKKDHIIQVEWLADFVSKNTLVDIDVIQKAIQAHSKIIYPGDYSRLEEGDYLNIFRFNFSLEADFYLSIVTIYDLAMHAQFFGEAIKNNHSSFQKIAAKYVKSKNIRNLFEGALDTIRCQNLDPENKPVSWGALADHIDTSDPHNLMNKWRRGKERPAPYTLSSLINNVDCPKTQAEKFITAQNTKASIALDKLLSGWGSAGEELLNELDHLNIQIAEEQMNDLIKEVVGGLDKFYETYSYRNDKR